MTLNLSARIRRSTALRASAMGLTGLIALGACGGGSDTDAKDPGSSQGESGDKDSDVKLEDTMDAGELSTIMFDAMKAEGSGTMTMQGLQTGTIDFSFANDTMAQHSTITAAGMKMEVIRTGDGDVYMSGMPGSAKPWAKLSAEGTDPYSQMMRSMLDSLSPDALADKLSGIDAKRTSQDGGNSTYEATIDAAALMGGDAAGADTKTKMAWTVEASGLPVSVTVSDPTGGESEVTYSDWGKKVTIEAPPQDEVGEMPQIPGMPSPSAS